MQGQEAPANTTPAIWDLGTSWLTIGGTETYRDDFTGANGDPLDPTKWSVEANDISIQAGRATVLGTEQGEVSVIGTIDVPAKGGTFLEIDWGFDVALDPNSYWQFGFQLASRVGTSRSRIKFAYSGGVLTPYVWDDAGNMTAAPWQIALDPPPCTMKIRLIDPGAAGVITQYEILRNGVVVRPATHIDTYFAIGAGPIRPWVVAYQGGNLNPIWFDNFRAGRG
jgi:hypothetical protein